jgi:hypothetical protein
MAEMSLSVRLSVLVVATVFLNNAQAIELATYKVADLAYGVNLVDFGPIGTRGTVVLGWRENFNAHGFGVATFYLTGPTGQMRGFQAGTTLGLVTVWDDVKNSKEALTVTTSGGADCVLRDFRLLVSSEHKPALLVLADRTMGDSYGDENSVGFKIYTLKQNTEQIPGPPTYYFDLTDQLIAKRKYCDVERAFHDEISIGDYRDRAK